MRKVALAGVVMLLSVTWAVARGVTGGNDESLREGQQGTVQGCLRGEGTAFVLTDKAGIVYYVTGDRSVFAQLAGREVEVTGRHSPVMRSEAGYADNTSGGTLSTFHIDKISEVASLCTTGG
jgi:hypothetical protein